MSNITCGTRFLLARRRALLWAGTVLAASGVVWQTLPWAFELPPALTLTPPVSARYLARDGSTLRLLLDPDGRRSGPETAYPDLPRPLIEAVIAAEDRRFFEHGGIDYAAIARAFWDNLRAGRVVSGASTIPQQLIKISSPPARRTLWVKFVEAQRARRLVREWPREQILAAWLNRVSYGNLLTGCRSAAEGYFNKPLCDLTVAECALLAGLPQAPGRLNPLRRPEAARLRQRFVLERMREEGFIDAETHARALAQDLVLSPSRGGFMAPHATEWLRLRPLPVDGTIRTTLDAALQRRMEQVLAVRLNGLRERHVTQAAAVILDNATSDVLALAGSRDFSSPDGGQINGAWTPRSPGSALKPFTCALALQSGRFSPASVIADLPVSFPTPTGLYRPENYTGKCFGPVTLRAALGNSLNIAAVKILDQSGGPEALWTLLRRLGLGTLDEPAEHYGLGLTLGNAPTRLLELTNAYACLARLGEFRPWRLLADAEAGEHERVLNAVHAWQIADILSDNQARLLTFGARSPLRMGFRVAVKTGTSASYRDNWALGYTPEFTIGVWVGNFDRTPMQGVSGVTGSAPILADLFALVRERFGATTWYNTPVGLETVRIDPRTGKRLTAQSPKTRLSRSETLTPAQLPAIARKDDYDSHGRALLPPGYNAWVKSADNWLGDLVACAPTSSEAAHELRLLQPVDGAVYRLDPDLPGGGRVLRLRSNRDTEPGLVWQCATLELSRHNDTWTASLTPGEHLITLRQGTQEVSARLSVVEE